MVTTMYLILLFCLTFQVEPWLDNWEGFRQLLRSDQPEYIHIYDGFYGIAELLPWVTFCKEQQGTLALDVKGDDRWHAQIETDSACLSICKYYSEVQVVGPSGH